MKEYKYIDKLETDKYKLANVKINKDLHNRLKDVKKYSGTSISYMVERAVEVFLKSLPDDIKQRIARRKKVDTSTLRENPKQYSRGE